MRRLRAGWDRSSVPTFFFKDDARVGDRLSSVMHRGINEHDRVILICPRRSLDRFGLLNELQETFDREARDGGNSYLLPVRLELSKLIAALKKKPVRAIAYR